LGQSDLCDVQVGVTREWSTLSRFGDGREKMGVERYDE
jgi:hypothetical protein